MRTHTRLNVSDGDVLLESRERDGECGGCVALYENEVWTFSGKDGIERGEHAHVHVVRRLSGRHHLEVIIEAHAEQTGQWIEEVRVLCGGDVNRLKFAVQRFELTNHPSQFDNFGTRPEEN